jgi:DNA-binding NarL/FixJ family response regulator
VRKSDRDPGRPGVILGAHPAIRRLSERERQVALLIAQGLKDVAIARRLELSPSTVATYIKHIRWRLNLSSRDEIAAWVKARRNPDDPEARLRRGRDVSSD